MLLKASVYHIILLRNQNERYDINDPCEVVPSNIKKKLYISDRSII